MFSLAADGKTNKKGMPNPLRLAVIARDTFDTVQLPFPPAWMQRLGLALAAPLGRLLGYKPTYTSRRHRPRARRPQREATSLKRRLFWTGVIVALVLVWLIAQVLRAAEATAAAARRARRPASRAAVS